MRTLDDISVNILSRESDTLENILLKNRQISLETKESFFHPKITDLHDPYLLPDMEKCVERILRARDKQERIVIFGDYDVDGVSGTTILVRFLTEIGCLVSYRLPHRSRDGYGLKSYFLDELVQKSVSLVITVDCGTRDIQAIQHAKNLGIDVIVTDHHAVPEIIPEEAIGIINPKRKDSLYPFSQLAGSGVAFTLVHAILIKTVDTLSDRHAILTRYIDFASLGTVADCMPLLGENRVITTLGLKQMKYSDSAGLRKFLESHDDITGNADIIGFQIGPRINASGRMDTPLTALKWLLASEEKCDEYLTEIEELNKERQTIVKTIAEKALLEANPDDGILFFLDNRDDSNPSIGETLSIPRLEHGLIGLIAGKLTEAYHQPSIVLCEHVQDDSQKILVASCRSPEWCNLIELLESHKDFFVRYGGHRQAAGFSIALDQFESFRQSIQKKFRELYGIREHLPTKQMTVECILNPQFLSLETLTTIEQFQPFGIGNPKPKFLLENVTITNVRPLGKSGDHFAFWIDENPETKFVVWSSDEVTRGLLVAGNILSIIVQLSRNIWNGKSSLQCTLEGIIQSEK